MPKMVNYCIFCDLDRGRTTTNVKFHDPTSESSSHDLFGDINALQLSHAHEFC